MSSRRFGNSDKITEAREVLTLIRGELASTQTVGSAALVWGSPTIGTIECDDAANAGVSTNPARSDHQHAIVNAAPNANSVNLAASEEGTAAAFARSDHTHNLDESITPTWTGAHTFDDGDGNSPALSLIGGSNDDTAVIFLLDNATAGYSDLVLQLCDTGGESKLLIRDSTPADVLQIDSDGNIDFQADGNYIGRGSSSGRISFNASGNAVQLYSSADLELYSDAGSTRVGLWDGATGNITLDADSTWIGRGATAGRTEYHSAGNEMSIRSAGDFALYSSADTSTEVVRLDGTTGNITLADGAAVGQAAGPLLTFDDTNNYLEVTGCNVGIGTAAPSNRLHVYIDDNSNQSARFENASSGATALAAWVAQSDSAEASLIAYSTTYASTNLQDFAAVAAESAAAGLALISVSGGIDFYTNGVASANERMTIDTAGDVGIGATSPAGQLHVDQASTTAAQPVLYLDQGDVSEEMIEFATTIGEGNAIEAIGEKTLTTTHFIKVTLPGPLVRYIPVGTIA